MTKTSEVSMKTIPIQEAVGMIPDGACSDDRRLYGLRHPRAADGRTRAAGEA